MMKIKIKNFKVCDWCSDMSESRRVKMSPREADYYRRSLQGLYSDEDIEDWIEEFISLNNATLIDVQVVPIQSHTHNNGYDNTVYLQYIIKYETEAQ